MLKKILEILKDGENATETEVPWAEINIFRVTQF